MSEEEIEKRIAYFIRRTRRLLPDSFETEDLLDDLKVHIRDSLEDKRIAHPDEDSLTLLEEVLEDIGTPEDIADEYQTEQVEEREPQTGSDWIIHYVMRLVAAVLVAVLSAWIVSIVTDGAVNFWFATVVLVAFAFIEWAVRGKQTQGV
ncbi:MAG: hypothetical protein ACTSV3_00085 [Candidatus Thorarchaeota archaeon]|nr:MAG: hypothetical protein DRP09_11730 [Candidatus Thorarchaeota archaeon]RLI56815.1 MAG: hypothetical protein DRO87_07640 [Candidatus Thorarchaeota archaeon]